jgi:hypothetical protein
MANHFIAAALLLSGLLVVAASDTSAQTNTVKVEDRPSAGASTSGLVSSYSGFAGSSSNAAALIHGMESGSSVTLKPNDAQSGTSQPVTFTPATTKLGTGEVNIALSLAKAELSKLGITQPTPAQLAAALNGGTVTSSTGAQVQMKGVLTERKAGMGWGQIAQAMGFKLGALVSASKTEHAGQKEKSEKDGKGEKDAHEDLHKGGSADASHGATAGNGGGNGGNGGGNGGSHGGSKK